MKQTDKSLAGLVLPPLSASDVNDLLVHFIEKGLLKAVKSLHKQGVDINAKDEDGRTPLYTAAHSGKIDILKYFISKGADVNAKCNKGRTPLHLAAGWSICFVDKCVIQKGGG